MCWQYPLKSGTPRLCGVTPPLRPGLCAGLGVALACLVALACGRAVLPGSEAGLVACGCFFLCADGVADGFGEDVARALAETCCVLGAGPALKPRLEAAPLPGATSTNAATRRPARASGAAPNSRTFISAPRPPQDSAPWPDPAGPTGRFPPGPGLPGRDRPGMRRDGTAGLAKGPGVGVLGYQPT